MTEKAVFEIEFDSDQFIKKINDAINSTDKLDDSLKEVTTQAKGVSFSKPIAEINKLETAIKESQSGIKAGGKVLVEQMNQSAKAITDNEKAYRSFLNDLKKQLKSVTDQDEFKRLRDTISKTENSLAELTGETIKTEGAQKSARARMREMKQALIEMEDAGLDNTEMFRKMTIESAQLTDQMGDQAETIRVLSSDTYRLDAGVDTIKQLANVWSIAEGSLALFGLENEDVQKSIQKMIAIQTVANGIQELSTFLTGQSAGMIALKSGYNKALAATELLVASATNASTAATQAFSKALIATGIGAFIVGLGLLIAYWDDVSDAITGATDATRAVETANNETKGTVQDVTASVREMGSMFKMAKNEQVSKEKVLKKYNETFGDTLGVAKSYNEAEALFISKSGAYIQSVKQRELATSFYKVAAEKEVEAAMKLNEGITTMERIRLVSGNKTYAQIKSARNKEYNDAKKGFDEIYKLGDNASRRALKLQEDFNINLGGGDDTKEEKVVENIYKELKKGFEDDLKAINEADLKGLEAVNAKAQKNYEDRIDKINSSLKDGKLTKTQAGSLRQQVGLIKNAEIQKETKKFIEERDKALLDAAKESTALQDQLTDLQISNIEESYDKQLKVIHQAEKMRLKGVEDSRIAANEKVKELQKQGYIDNDEANKRIAENNRVYQEIEVQNRLQTNKELQEANIQRLEDLQTSLQNSIDSVEAKIAYELATEIAGQRKLYNEGKISREEYQNSIDSLNKVYQVRKEKARAEELAAEIKNIEDQIAAAIDGEEKKKLITEKYQKATELANLQNKEKEELTFFESLFGDDQKAKDKAKAVIDLTQQVFDTTANLMREQARMETEAYDRAIKLQEDRVSEAQKIADAGNAEYLQAEKDRLNELEAKREQSARRQLEIDQAIQASQILVAVAGAAAQIAKGGPANVIAGITTIVGAIGAGVSLVRQSQAARPQFYDGTEYLERGNNPVGRDTIPVMAHEGERIVPSYINSKLKGIKNSDLPKLVEGNLFDYNFVNVKDDSVLKSDTSVMEKRLSNLEALQAENNEYLKKLSINVTMDSEGFATSITTMMDNKRKMNNA